MNSRSSPSRGQRDLQIEILRLRAQYQRQAWERTACQAAGSLQPAKLLSSTRDQLGATGLGWLGSALGLLRRYPVLLSVLGSVAGTPSRRRFAIRAALIAGLVWLGKRGTAESSQD